MSKTRPCKDCKNHGILYQNGIENDIVYMIKCRGCENQTNYYDTSDAAIDAWNHEFGKPKTNREWLMSLSDEDLAYHLRCPDYWDIWNRSNRNFDDLGCGEHGETCTECAIYYLNSGHREVSE